jgi:hypothetical protein
MGWINIDKLTTRELTASVSINREPNSSVFIIIDDMNSVLQYSGEAMKLPANTPVTIFSVMLKDNMPHYAVEKVELKKKTNQVELKYKEGVLKDIRAAIQQAV